MYKVQLNIYDAVNKLEGQNKRRYSDAQIGEMCGLHRHTIHTMRTGKDEPTLNKLLDFFQSEGMPIKIQDLFTVTTTTQESQP